MELEAQVNASGTSSNAHSLPAALAVQAQQLLNQDALSDIDIELANGIVHRGHRFLLAARSKLGMIIFICVLSLQALIGNPSFKTHQLF